MPLDVTKANAKTAAINDAFAAIGTGDMPKSKLNTEALAWEYHWSSHLLRIAEARKKAAIKAAVKAGVMFDPEKAPLAASTNLLIYAGQVVEISVAVGTAATRLDVGGMMDDLVAHRVKRELIDQLIVKHTSENRAAHKFTSTLVTV